ncbi:DUF2510 domain-containing protein [Mycobacterium sp. CnD-18-1]|nr:DUF2510 domain-containing protein [Mycobacterium sp. CnD-18-1]
MTLPQSGWFADPWNGGQLRYFDGRRWTGDVAAPERVAGFPLGQRSMVFRTAAGRSQGALCCWVTGDRGVHVATITSRSRLPSLIGRDTRTLVFDVVEPNGVPMLTLTRHGGARELRITVEDPDGAHLGQLRQISSAGRQFRTGQVTLAVESGQQHVATADLGFRPSDNRYADVQESIFDASGTVIATLARQGRFTASLDLTGARRESSFAYKLDCALRLAEPVPTLLLATGFTYYLCDRIADGGFFGAISRYVLQPSWERHW